MCTLTSWPPFYVTVYYAPCNKLTLYAHMLACYICVANPSLAMQADHLASLNVRMLTHMSALCTGCVGDGGQMMTLSTNTYIHRCILYISCMYCTVLYCTVLYCTVLYYTVLYYTVLYCTVLYCTILYCTVLYCMLFVGPVCCRCTGITCT